MNKLMKKISSRRSAKNRKINIAISIVILAEIIALLVVGTFAWVETVSSIKITNASNTVGMIADATKYTDMMIGDNTKPIDLMDYFTASGDIHLAPASSADGTTFYFPKVNDRTNFASAASPTYNVYRKGNVSDKNTTYLSITFRLKADTNADFFFTETPAISVDNNIRVSVTSQSMGSTEAPVTTIYANQASTASVVNSTSGTTGATTVLKFSDHVKGKSSTARLFAVGADETKLVTINVWLQKTSENDDDLTTAMSASQVISHLGITSSLTPRHVTLIPTPTWDTGSPTYYAWCWNASNGDKDKLYKLTLDDNEHYAFDYNGTYQNTLFIRAESDCSVKADFYDSWPFTGSQVKQQTVDTKIPSNPDDPYYVIKTLDGSDGKATGEWLAPSVTGMNDYAGVPGVATVKVALCTGQDQPSAWGTVSATSYIGTATTSHVMESTNSGSQKHKDTVHAWPGKILQLTANPSSGYAFVGWYDNAAGTGNALNTNATYTPNAPSTDTEITYYAKFIKTYTFKLTRTVDGSTTSTVAAGTMTVNGSTTNSTTTSKSVTVNEGSNVAFSAAAETGYTFEGFYTAATDGSSVTSPLSSISANTTYYARFTTNSYNVTANAYYLDGSYTAGSTGGTVQVGTATAGATSTASVKYKTSVTLTATPASGYDFVGWFSSTTATTATNTSTSYTYTLNTAANKTFYARFRPNTFTVTARAYYSTNGGTSYSSGSTGGTVKVGSSSAGSTSSASVTVGSNVTLTATAASGYEFVGWYTAATGGSQIDTSASYSYKLSTYANVNVYARFKQVNYYLTGYINGGDVSGTTHQFTLSSGTTYTYTYTFTGGSDQWVTVYDGTNAYHPGTHGAGSSTAADTSLTDTTPAGVNGNKWNVAAPKGANVTFTWNSSTKKLSWTINSREIFLNVSNWGYSDARYAVWINNNNAFYNMTKVSNTLYKITLTTLDSKIIFCRMNGSTSTNSWNNVWNQTADLDLESDKNYYTINGYSYGTWSLN